MSDVPEEKMESEKIGALAAALAKAQGQMQGAKKESANPQFGGKKYADLASVWEACRAPLSANGLAVTQTVSSGDGGVRITTTLLHSSGEWMRDRCTFPVTQNTPQGYGSAITYGRRYALAALVGVAPDEDDDGNAASAGGQQQGQVRTQPQTSNRTTTDAVREKLAAKAGASRATPWARIQGMAATARIDPAALKALVKQTVNKGKPSELTDADVVTVGRAVEELVKARGYDPVTGEVLEGAHS